MSSSGLALLSLQLPDLTQPPESRLQSDTPPSEHVGGYAHLASSSLGWDEEAWLLSSAPGDVPNSPACLQDWGCETRTLQKALGKPSEHQGKKLGLCRAQELPGLPLLPRGPGVSAYSREMPQPRNLLPSISFYSLWLCSCVCGDQRATLGTLLNWTPPNFMKEKFILLYVCECLVCAMLSPRRQKRASHSLELES